MEHHTSVGLPQHYFIHAGYQHRANVEHFDDTANREEWQQEVYQFAKEVADREHLQTVCDFGCGSAFKLMRYLSNRRTIGIETPQTCAYLRKRWPDRIWMESNYDRLAPFPVDLAIAADVIEHLENPDDLIRYLQRLTPRYIVISTPDRNLLRDGRHDGPPANPSHTREWSFAEFHAYIGNSFEIEEHFISSAAQATQCVLCQYRRVVAPR